VTERLRVREIDDEEGRRLVRIIRRGAGSVVTWRRAQMVLLSAQGMDAPAIAKVAFTSEDRVRDVIRNFNADGFGSLYPKYKGGRPPKFTLPQRREIKRIANARPGDYDLPFSAWSLSKLADFLVAAQFTALRYFALDGTDHATHKEQASMIRRYIIWRNNHAYDERLRRIVDRTTAA
jgi:transposase